MSPEKQRIAIAEACGWKDFNYEGRKLIGKCPKSGWRWPVHDYLNDLNAIAEAEKVIPEEKWPEYTDHYGSVIYAAGGTLDEKAWRFMHPTAAQRAEAFLKTLGLWED